MASICPEHGQELVERPSSTPEQTWCGTWFRCPDCERTVLVMSDALIDEYEAAYRRISDEYAQLRTEKQRAMFLNSQAPWFVERLKQA